MKRLLALALLLAAPATAQQVVNLRDADIRAFIQDASRVTGRTFIIDPRVQGKVSVVTDRALNRAEYLELFLSTLRANGLVAVPTGGGAFRVQPSDTVAAQPSTLGSRASANRFVTDVIRLRSIDAQTAVETLRPLVSREGQITANRSSNTLIVADYGDNLRRVRALVAEIDRDRAATRVIELQNAGARELAQSLTALVGGGGQGTAPPVTVVAVDSANAIALRGDAAAVARFAEIARDLDRRAASGAEIRVIFLENADAAQLVPVLQQIVGQPVTQPTQQPLSGRGRGAFGSGGGANAATANVPPPPVQTAVAAAPASDAGPGSSGPRAVIARFEGANAVVISAPPELQRTLGEVVRQLDTRREQVLVEAIIAEISDNAARRLGVQFLLGGEPGSNIPFAATNYSNAQPNILTVAGAIGARELDRDTTVINGSTVTTTSGSAVSDTLAQAAVDSILNAGSLIGFGGRIGDRGIFGAIINAVKSDTESNILSTPWIVTADNNEAYFLVGQEVPVTTGQVVGNDLENAFNTIQRQNVGIQLEVRPQVSTSGAIKLQLRQEVSSIAGPVSRANSELILNKREFETVMTVDDGQIVAVGGLLDDNERRTLEKIPFLGDLPLLGELFRSRSRARTKTNLVVFIRPTILRSAADARRLAEQRYGYIQASQAAQRPDREPTIDELVRDYMGAVPPAPALETTPPDDPRRRLPAEPAPAQVYPSSPGGEPRTTVPQPAPPIRTVPVPPSRTERP